MTQHKSLRPAQEQEEQTLSLTGDSTCIQGVEGIDGGPFRDKLPHLGKPFKAFERKVPFQYLISNNIYKHSLIGRSSVWKKINDQILQNVTVLWKNNFQTYIVKL